MPHRWIAPHVYSAFDGHKFIMPKLPKDRPVKQGLRDSPRQTVPKPDVPDDRDAQVELTALSYVGSYNWVNSPDPTIVVPGSPRRWLDRELPFNVKADSGIVFVDQNAFRMKDTPLLPLIRAVELVSKLSETSNPEGFGWPNVDFVTDRSNLRKILRWIDGSAGGRALRIDAQLAGNGTILLNRWERRTREYGSGSYGFNLEKATTAPAQGCEGTTAHHRIVKYIFAGLLMIVRFEVDAFAPSVQPTAEDADLLGAFKALTVAQAPVPASSGSLNIRRGGSVVHQSSLIELTSASKMNWQEKYPQLYLSQTAWMYKASHREGCFHDVKKTALGSQELATVAEQSKLRFARLGNALKTIKNIVVEAGPAGRLSFVLENKELIVYERESQKSCLPADAMSLFS
ncbi:hypothetical protein HWV62_7364 [Athelia sp. TMB]|nr:hypothetical protein HWV62_7364 [Athelia sp. TMB]